MSEAESEIEPIEEEQTTKDCPACAETIKAQAKVCRFCNYDFEPKELTPIGKKGEVYCNDCKCVDYPKTIIPGHFLIEIILWFCYVIPGLIFTIWRHSAQYKGCRNCKSRHIMPAMKKLV